MDGIENTINENLEENTCTYLALGDDPKTQCAFPSSENHCYRCNPKAVPKFQHQRDICLTPNYINCPVYQNPPGEKMPQEIRYRHSKSLPLKPAYFLIIALVIIGIASGFVFGFWQDIFGTEQEQPEQQETVSGVIVSTETPTSTATIRPEPTATLTLVPTMTQTATPTITATMACDFSLEYLGTSSSTENRFRISYSVPTDLSAYLKDEVQRRVPFEVSLPDFVLTVGDEETNDYWTYMRDLDSPSFLFIEFIAEPGDDVSFEYTDSNNRYCTQPITVIRLQP